MIGTILLTYDNVYVKEDGSLPKRPKHDKELLTEICRNHTVSKEAYNMLPPSIQRVASGHCIHYDIPITIRELSNADILIVSRSLEICRGKEFRLDNFKCLVKDRKIEIWRKL